MADASRKAQPERHRTLRAALRAERMTQRRLAQLLGKDDAYVSKLINRKFKPSLAMADRIQRILNVDLSAMI